MSASRFAAAFAACLMTLAAALTATPAVARDYLQCVPFARAESGVEIRGNAGTWWAQAEGQYDRGGEPREGAVMAFAGTRAMPIGHVAVVKKIVSDREILIDHANWSPIGGRRGQIERDVRVVDVSNAGDWSMVRVWYAPIGDLGLRANPVQGFIYPGRGATPRKAPSFEAPVWASNDWKPGNDLERIVASLGQ
ncbi:CHAP domain-containing protein [Sphingopyxis sp. PET50]|uniref:CHAP domain-containing protein n=1 Tax=Sphingopyxis sp. PET50 TaxID=2976533 RepID=UPI0021B027D9|nr:CHAP domain-containing protein [Sphingopyxis sp. PET50]